jgi:hypothetical protein
MNVLFLISQEIQKKYTLIDEALKQADWEDTGYSYAIRTIMSNAFDCLRRYEDKDMSDMELAEKSLLAVQENLEKAQAYHDKYEKVATLYNSVNWDDMYEDIENTYRYEISMIHSFFDEDTDGYYDTDNNRVAFNGQVDELMNVSHNIERIKDEVQAKENIVVNTDDLASLLAATFGDSAVKQRKRNKE